MYHFDANRVSAIAMGISLFEFGKGEFLTMTPREKNFTEIEGTHGAAIRAGMPSTLYDIKAMILQGSPVNAQISARVNLDTTTGQGVGVLLVKDLEGSSLVTAEISYFYPPEIKRSTEPLLVEWNGCAQIMPSGWLEGASRYLVAA